MYLYIMNYDPLNDNVNELHKPYLLWLVSDIMKL